MTRQQLELMREWVKAQVEAVLTDSMEDEHGYYGTGYAENRHADELFSKLLESVGDE